MNKAALRTFLTSGDPLEQAERNWLAEAAADPSGDAHRQLRIIRVAPGSWSPWLELEP